MMAAQNQGLTTRATLHFFDNTVEPNCRFCRQETESPAHLQPQWETFKTQGRYTTLYKRVSSDIHCNVIGAR